MRSWNSDTAHGLNNQAFTGPFSRRIHKIAFDILKYFVANSPHPPNTIVAYTRDTHNSAASLLSAAKLDRSTPKSQGGWVHHSQYIRRLVLFDLLRALPRCTFGKQFVHNCTPVLVGSLIDGAGLWRGR